MSVTTTNFQYPTLKWREKGDPSNLLMTNTEPDNISSTVDDGLTSLSWLQNLNMCMTRLGAPTPPTPPASPVCFGLNYQPSSNRKMNSTPILPVCISSKCKGAVPSSDNVERANSCNQASATSSRNGYSARVQNESQAQSTVSHKSEASKKRASSSQSKPTSSKQSKKGTPQYSPSPPQPSQDVVDYKSNGIIKPPYSYATLICMAMKANKNKMTLSSIYKWIKENFLYYRNADPSWQNSIRHNLSLNKCFIKIARNKDEPGKGGFWKLDPVYSDSLVDGIFKKRRPSHKPSETGNGTVNNAEAKSTKKKSRKKNPTMESNNYIDVIKMHQETPPNSAESYSYKEKMTDASEIVTAVNSINSCTYAYTLHSANIVDCEQGGNLVHGYATEVCIANPANNECIIESDGNDICWNAILTEADLNELVDPITYTDSVGQIIHPIENEIVNTSTPHAKTTTAQLTAVEPHDLDMVATSSNLLEEQQLFYHANQLHSISFEANAGNVITATSNVVTCINDAHITSHWNGWHPYHPNGTMRIECPSRNAELILSQIEQGHDQIMAEVNVVNSNSPIYITNGTPLMSANPLTQMAPKHIPTPVPTPTSTPSMVAESQTMETNSQSPTNYEPASSLQPWAECKAALEAAALDLESFGNLEPIQQF